MNRIQSLEKVISKPLDRRIVEQLSKGGRSFDYVSGPTMYTLLTQAFGPFYSVEFSEPRVTKYEKVRPNDPDPAAVVEVKCTITVPFYDEETQSKVIVKREGFGTATMKSHFEEMVLKTAQTDALKKAAYSFGIALELSAQKTQGEKDWYAENVFGMWTQSATQKHVQELSAAKAAMQKYGIANPDQFAQAIMKDPNARMTPNTITEIMQKYIESMNKSKKEENAA